MNLFGEFEKRRGCTPPIPASKCEKGNQADELTDTWKVLKLAFDGRLRQSCLIPVLPEYRVVFGDVIWICPDEDRVQNKQAAGEVAFTPDELMDIIRIAAQDQQSAAGIVAVKKSFGGIITR
ncbi:hypothetical protein SOV_17160 [Sporomusa ovata DSM 2662]|uniref:Uncharacterized protein n=1 Tax=Sporomusa ovata TaxID=2378 RepID=A0A0U1KV89_9FIRM|nr:hypothetical protein [Sporomusa ovata]EQB29316.1 hypothetical protein SOV_1c10490 [Sporomusa ovata DSM 2662]CQR71357.1 hypothetical protein SpAn4DRAFT_3862 [Sporomusa ovata]